MEAGRGFARLPEPSAGDVFFDIEGHPYFTAASDLTFLFGLILADGGTWRYEPIWAHDLEQEGAALERVVDRIGERLAAYPDMHVYHYSPAEPGVLQRLMARHATREAEVDVLLRQGVLVDLYYVLRQGMRVGVESYGLKHVERLAGFERSAEVGRGSDAVLAYDTWMHGGDQAELTASPATTRRTAARRWPCATGSSACGPGEVPPAPIVEVRERSERRSHGSSAPRRCGRCSSRARSLAARAGSRASSWSTTAARRVRAGGAGTRCSRWTARSCVATPRRSGCSSRVGRPNDAGGVCTTLRFPAAEPQARRAAMGSTDPETGPGVNLVADDDASGTRARAGEAMPRTTGRAGLIPGGPFNTEHSRRRCCGSPSRSTTAPPGFPALEEILARNLPRFADRPTGAQVQTTDLAEQQQLARDRSTGRTCWCRGRRGPARRTRAPG